MRYFVSDLHFFHQSVIKFGKRPYSSLEEMHEGLIYNWNSRVTKKDEIFVIGDFSYRNKKDDGVGAIFHRLNFQHAHLIRGNHDNKRVLELPWTSVSDYKEIHECGSSVVLCHYPFRSWNKMYHGAYHLHGHEHGNVVDYSHFDNFIGKGGSCDVSCDVWNWSPVTFQEILERIKTKGQRNPDLFDADGNDRTKRRIETDEQPT